MFVNVNQLTGIPVSDDQVDQAEHIAQQLQSLSANDVQLVSQQLGYVATLALVSELLHGVGIAEDVVIQALDLFEVEQARVARAELQAQRYTEPFL